MNNISASPRQSSSPPPSRWYRWSNRLLACAFAVCLLWLTSMQVVVTLVQNFIASPPIDHVISQGIFTYDVASQQKDDFSSCVSLELSTCHSEFNAALIEEERRAAAAAVENSRIVALASSQQETCSSQLDAMREVLSAWQQIPGALAFTSTCPPADHRAALTFINTNSYSGSVISAQQQVSSYSHGTQSLLTQLQIGLEGMQKTVQTVRQTDRATLAAVAQQQVSTMKSSIQKAAVTTAQQIQSQVDNMVACVGGLTSTGTGTCQGASLYDLYQQQYAAMAWQQQLIAARRTQILQDLDTMEADILSAEAAFTQFYNTVVGPNGLLTVITNLLQQLGVPSSNLCGLTSPSWCDFNPYRWAVYIPQLTMLRSLSVTGITPIEQVWATVNSTALTMSKSIAASSTQLATQVNSSAQQASTTLTTTATSVLAPISNANITTLVSQQGQLLDAFQANITNTLLAATATTNSTSPTVDNSTAPIAPPLSTIGVSNFLLKYGNFSKQHIDISAAAFLETLASFQGVLFFLDTIYRSVQSIILLARYWDNSVIELPILDVRLLHTKQNNYIHALISKQRFLQYTSYIWSSYGFMLIAIIILFILLADMYIQLYYSYYKGCVQHVSQDTFFSSLIVPSAYSYASSSGSAKLANGIETYNYNASTVCAVHQLNSTNSFTNSQVSLHKLYEAYNNDQNNLYLINSCVDISAMDRVYMNYCGNNITASMTMNMNNTYTNSSKYNSSSSTASSMWSCPVNVTSGLAYKQPGAYLQNITQCNATFDYAGYVAQLQPSGFNCTSLPTCSTRCNGPDGVTLQSLSRQSSCMGEWYLHSKVFTCGLAILIYILLYLSCMYIHQGLLILTWRHLRVEEFELVATCDERGVPLLEPLPPITTSTSTSIKAHTASSQLQEQVDARREDLRRRVRSFEFGGYVSLAIGVLLNGIWLALLWQARNSIAYSPI